MGNNMKVYYNDGEIDNFKVSFESFDIESMVAPMLGALIFEEEEKQFCIFLDQVKKIEIEAGEEL